jgi:hypothetical protein
MRGVCASEDGSDPIALVLRAVERLRARARDGRVPAQIAQELIDLRHVVDLMELEFSAVAAEFAASDEYERRGSATPVHWIRHSCNMSGHAASGAVCVGEQMDRLPSSLAALDAGDIGFSHVALLAGTARAAGESPTAQPFDEEPLLRKALVHTVSRFRHDCAHARHKVDAEAFLAEQVETAGWRRLELLPCEDGALVVRGFLDSVGGATLRSALEPLARRTGAGDDRTRDKRLADALVELANHALDAGLVPQQNGVRTHLQVTATVETLLGIKGAPAGELTFSPPIAAATVQRLACDAGITRVVLDPASAVVDVGRLKRLPSGATRRALNARDGGCVWPGCERPATWTNAHHLMHWAHGGPTDLGNLVLLCYRHHWMVHEGGWQLARTDDRGVVVVPPPPDHVPLARARGPDAAAA